MYDAPPDLAGGTSSTNAQHGGRHRRPPLNRGSSILSQLSGGFYSPGGGAGGEGWRGRLWLWGWKFDRWMFKGIPPGYPLRAKVKITLQVRCSGAVCFGCVC